MKKKSYPWCHQDGCFRSSHTLQHYQEAWRASVPTRITECHLDDAGRYVSFPHQVFQNESGIPKARNNDVLCRQQRHVTDAQPGLQSLLPHFSCFHSFQPGSQSTVTFSHTSHFDVLPSHPYHQETTKPNETPQHRKHGHPLHHQGRRSRCSGPRPPEQRESH